jgi:hypothetical protein
LVSGIARLLDRREHAYLSAVDASGDLSTISRIWECFANWRASFANASRKGQITTAIAMFFAFPEDARWNATRQAVEFGVEIG